jgi:hypothetical protein
LPGQRANEPVIFVDDRGESTLLSYGLVFAFFSSFGQTFRR